MGISLTSGWSQSLGLARSYIIYLANPLKRWRMRRFYAQMIRPGDWCFDIGAHLGIHTRIWNELGAHSVAVEPNPKFFQYLQKRMNGTNVLLPDAIADRRDQMPMFISSLAPTVSTLATKDWRSTINSKSSFDVQWDQEILVRTTTLDALIDEYGVPTFIKLDIEDFEQSALAGLHHPVPYISFEFFSYYPDRILACLQEIERNGQYEYNFSLGEQFRFGWRNWRDSEEFKGWVTTRKSTDPHGDIYARWTGGPEPKSI